MQRHQVSNRSHLLSIFAATVLAALAVAGSRPRPENATRDATALPVDKLEQLQGSPGVEACITGCAAVPDTAGDLQPSEITRCLAAVATQGIGVASIELETLLFHADDVRDYTHRYGFAPLDPALTAFLRDELDLRNALVSLRITDTEGVERIAFEQTVPIGAKQHLPADEGTDITPPELSFTVQRVGLYHLWTRI